MSQGTYLEVVDSQTTDKFAAIIAFLMRVFSKYDTKIQMKLRGVSMSETVCCMHTNVYKEHKNFHTKTCVFKVTDAHHQVKHVYAYSQQISCRTSDKFI